MGDELPYDMRAARKLIDTPEKLAFLRETTKQTWFQICVINDNLTHEGLLSCFDRAIAELDALCGVHEWLAAWDKYCAEHDAALAASDVGIAA